MSTSQVNIYVDIGSPFSCIAFNAVSKSPAFSNCKVTYVPVVLREVMQKANNVGPFVTKNKFQWIQKERMYWSRRFGASMTEQLPVGFPATTTDIQARLSVVAKEYPDYMGPLLEKLYHIFWAKADTTIVTPAQFTPIIESVLGENAQNVLSVPEEDAKALLDANTQTAHDLGAFGLPWFECTNAYGEKDGFWGIDHLGRVAEFFQLDISVDERFSVLL
ncbi:hypothetical protein N7495_005507 [Penicillium taxi]|uniref:uncharacterized protein n=1 Tax=Penicillium taxi TaxID=168475 RepID=UPI002545AB76|nr:uncharacterized protein N7495_005507 [Penicillium taxi]KAJ5893816.1 hypothetical protein N7495_005507 [Penicillium taxi]